MPHNTINHPWSAALRERFGFETPTAFKALEARGLLRWVEDFHSANLSLPGDHYLWLNDMEWYQPDDLLTFKFESYHKSGFVPFAHAASGDFWCWYPKMQEQDAVPVLLCPHDCYDANLYAPDFASALYRHAVEYAAELIKEDDERKSMLKRWAVELGPLWPTQWRRHIEHLVNTPMVASEYAPHIASTFGDKYAKHFQVRWMEEA